jgi:hypothetical protein
MLERDIEAYLREQVKLVKGRAYKWVSPGNNGVPDRIIFFPAGRIVFVELKAPGKKPTPLQAAQGKKITAMGQLVVVIDTKAAVDTFILEHGGSAP